MKAQNKRYGSNRNLSSLAEEMGNSHIKVNVWVATISSEGKIMYEILDGMQTADKYLELVERQLGMMDFQKNYFFFQQESAAIHTAHKVVKYLKSNLNHHWIGKKRGGEKDWAPRSPDLSALDYFFFWSYVQSQLLSYYDLETKADFQNSLLRELPKVRKK